MIKNFKPLLFLAAGLLLLYILFRIHFLLLFIAIVLLLVFSFIKNRSNLMMYKGNRFYEQGQTEQALVWFKKAAEYRYSNFYQRNVYGYMLLRAGHVEEAEQVFEKLLQENLDRINKRSVHLNMGLVRWKQGRIAEAVERIENVYEDYRNTIVYGSLGYLYIANDELDKALTLNLEAYEYNASDPVILDNLGQTYFAQKNFHQAEKIYLELMELQPKFPEPYYHFALVRNELGDRRQAIELLQKGLQQPTSSLSTVGPDEIEKKLTAFQADTENREH